MIPDQKVREARRNAVRELKALEQCSDKEDAHVEADLIVIQFLRDTGHKEVAKAWENVRASVGFWYS